uniref:Tubulointerstitial nephritis antigen n=1 Tax=Sphenodon punctatus TaxID=8508 RepID=A0A8D0GQQ2_SPHPU
MWIKSQLLVLCCLATEVWMDKQFAFRNKLQQDYNNSGRNRLGRTLHRRDYCGRQGCCRGRDDGCIFQYFARDAVCYCDDFCTSGPPGPIDCCPDFWTACYGHPTRHPRTEPIRPTTLEQNSNLFFCSVVFSTCKNNQWICSHKSCLVHPDLIKKINSGNYGWKASNYSKFWGMTLEEGFNYRLGTLYPSAALLGMEEIMRSSLTEADFPEFFIASYEWPGWTHGPLDQKNCGILGFFSCVAADRITIHSKGQFTDNLSPQHLISCGTRNQHGCNGGNVDDAWSYLREHGLVSQACYPLSWNQPYESSCAISSITDDHGKSHCSLPYRISSWNEGKSTLIMFSLLLILAVMRVYEDFFLYKSGIYKHTGSGEGQPQRHHRWGAHSVKITGTGWGGIWGKKIAAKSWGKSWGENGYFRILRGQNDCDIETLILATKGLL